MREMKIVIFVVVASAACAATPSDPGGGDVVKPHAGALSGDVRASGSMPCTCTGDDFVCPRAARGFEISPVPLSTAGKSADEITRIGYGSYLLNATADCASCHSSAAGFLAGGNPFQLDNAGHVVWSRNLTPDPVTGLHLSESEFMAVIRTGRDFHPGSAGMLVVMPWVYFRWASDGDLRAIYAYLRAVPPASNAVPPDQKSGLGLPPMIPFPGVYNDGDVTRPLPADPGTLTANLTRGEAIQPLAAPCKLGDAAEFARGSYLVNSLSTCGECHTRGVPGGPLGRNAKGTIATDHYMTGGNVFLVPPPLQPVIHQNRTMSANLTGAAHGFFHEPAADFALFQQILETQSHADEMPARPLGFPMPAEQFRHMLEPDLRAIFTYVTHITPNVSADERRQDYARWCASAADCAPGETCHADPDPTVGSECVGRACVVDADCDACQTCAGHACIAPAADSTCLL